MPFFIITKRVIRVKRRNKGEGSITYAEDKKLWRAELVIGHDPATGKKIRKILYSKTKTGLIQKMQDYKKDKNLLPKEQITFDSYFYKCLYLIKKPQLKDRSFERYQGLHENYIKKAPFYYQKIADINYTDIQIWYNSGEIPDSSLRIIHSLIKETFKTAKKDKLILQNPLDDAAIEIKSRRKENYNVFTSEEQQKFLHYLYAVTIEKEPLKYMYIFALATGLRLGEILALEKSDIKDGKVYVNKNLQRVKNDDGKYENKIISVKTQSSESAVPMPKTLQNILPEIMNTQGDLLFPDEITGGYMNKNRPYKRLKSLCKKLEITQISFHGLRHSYATRLFETGVQIKTVQKLMRHSDIQTTMNIYIHVMPDVVEDAIEKLDNIFSIATT